MADKRRINVAAVLAQLTDDELKELMAAVTEEVIKRGLLREEGR
jgi:hypothetical protein